VKDSCDTDSGDGATAMMTTSAVSRIGDRNEEDGGSVVFNRLEQVSKEEEN
jgi:hypothetical protein